MAVRIIGSFLCAILLSACGQNSEKTNTDLEEPGTVEWLEYKSKDKAKNKKIVLVSGDEEYRSEEALPMLAEILSVHHGFDCTVLFAQNPEEPGIVDPNYSYNIPGLDKLKSADLMILFTRFRSLPDDQMQQIDDFLKDGKPLIAIRTATHAFNFKDSTSNFLHYGFNYKGDLEEWQLGFGKFILGETWYSHHGHHRHQSTRGVIAPGARSSPILNGIEDGALWGPTDVYGIRMPMGGDAQTLVLGQSIDRLGAYDEADAFYGMKESDISVATKARIDKEDSYNPNDPMPPIVWTKSYQIPNGKKGQSFTSTLGSSTDMNDEEVRRLYVNAVCHLLDISVPSKANVELISPYNPSAYAFHKDEHWVNKKIKIEDYQK